MKEASSTIVVGKRAVCVFGISYNISYRSVSVLYIYDIYTLRSNRLSTGWNKKRTENQRYNAARQQILT